ncbi:MAG: erythrose-4-phosphate dehydrogenase, partial [Venatoribacter sp.]
VSALDVSLNLRKSTSSQEVNKLLQSAAENTLAEILGVTFEAHASIDFNHDARSGVVDASQTRVSNGHLLKLLVWCDNEWGFANRMLDTASIMAN